MKAIRVHENGGLDQLRYEEDVPEPELERDEVLIEVKACALNYLDIWVRKGLPGLQLPQIPGCDIAGKISKLGSEVTNFSIGDRVVINPGVSCGTCEWCERGEDSLCTTYHIIGEHVDGGYAEFAKTPARNLMLIPEEFSFQDAAAVPLVFLTAWRALITRAQIRPGEDVLILGASGGVGSACVQIAKLTGARVFATASTDAKLEQLGELGADVLINYSAKDFSKEVWTATNKRGVDVIVDSIGEATWAQSMKSAAKNGRIVTFGSTSGPQPALNIPLLFWKQLQIYGTTMGTWKEFNDVMNLVWAGKLKPVIDRVFPLQDAAKAQEMMENREVFGKLLVVPE
jgi:NADPH:quinone reductase-like Zn-dependent oxidoreductase